MHHAHVKSSVVLMAILLFCGCAPQKPLEFDRDFSENIVPFHQPLYAQETQSYALGELLRGNLFFEAGDRTHCDTRFANADKVMGQIAADQREGGAVAVNEQAKTYRGSPYERASMYVFRAICRYNQGDYTAALAASRAAIASDTETHTDIKAEKEDFGVAYFVAAMCHARLRERDNALQNLELAKRCGPSAARLSPDVLDANFIGVVGLGEGPEALQGAFASKEYVAADCKVTKIEVVVDGSIAGEALETTDLLVQAQSNQPGEADAAVKGRAAAKFILSVALSAVSGANVNIQENRDLRCWWGLPRKLYVFAVKVPPGTHSVAFRCYGKDGERLTRDEQLWYEYPVGAQPDSIAYFRLLRNFQNHDGLAAKPLPEVLAAKKKERNGK